MLSKRNIASLLVVMLVPMMAYGQGREEALSHLGEMNVSYTPDAFVDHAKQGNTVIVRFFLEAGMSPDVKDSTGRAALVEAAIMNHAETMNTLLERGADVNARDTSSGETALVRIAWMGHTDTLKMLLDKGADVNAGDNNGETALTWAAYAGHSDTVKILIDHGADVNARLHTTGETPLILVALRGYTEIVEALLAHGADVNAQNEINGETALMRASYVGFLDTVKVLLAHGADVNIQDFSGETALTMAGYGDHAGIVELLKKAGSPEK